MLGKLFALLFLICSLTNYQKAEKISIAAEDASIIPRVKVGEILTYSVKWNDLRAAKVIMSADNAKDDKYGDAYRVEVDVKTIGVARDLLVVNDRFAALLDLKTFLPFKAETEISEGPKSERGTINFDQEKHLATVGEDKAVPIEPKTHDIASLFWAIRGADLKENASYIVPAFNSSRKSMFAVSIEVGKSEEIATSARAYKAVQLTIKMIEQKQPSDKYQIRMWVTDDDRRLPILVTALPPFGKVKMELVDAGEPNDAEPSSPASDTASAK